MLDKNLIFGAAAIIVFAGLIWLYSALSSYKTAKFNLKNASPPIKIEQTTTTKRLNEAPSERVKRIMAGIAYVESRSARDPYRLVSKASKNGDRAYGKYQMMGNYIPTWTKEATGKSYAPVQFLSIPALQDQTAAFLINRHIKAGYNDNDIASIWFSGRPMKKAGNAKDVYGTSVPQYVKVFNRGIEKYDANIK